MRKNTNRIRIEKYLSAAAADDEAEARLRRMDEMESQARVGKDSLGFTIELLTAQEELETKVRPCSPLTYKPIAELIDPRSLNA